jgi:omega-amidase
MTMIKVAMAQMPVVVGAPDENLATAQRMAADAAEAGAAFFLLPELWGSGYDLSNATRHATSPTEGLFAEMAQMARQHQMWVGGSLLGIDPDHPAPHPLNLFALFAPDGSLAYRYAKTHLFRLMDEEKWLSPGAVTTLAKLPWGTAGMAICYDLRFPELFRAYALAGARLMLLPSEWPHPRLAHWRTLLRARAIENQCYVIACNRVGGDADGKQFFGHSAVIDPWGETVAEGDESAQVLVATIDLAVVDEVRRRIPVFEDRRPELYE